MSEYPQRERFYSHRFCRLLTKTAAAQEIGPEACWLLTVVAHQEDAKQYRGPVTYWNEQLMPLCGFGGRRRLVLARQKAIDAGWLHYEAGGKHKAGLYWTLIPDRFSSVADGPADEDSDDFCRSAIAQQQESSRSETEHQTERQESSRSEMTAKPERQTCADRNGKRTSFFPIPNPNPKESAAAPSPSPSESASPSKRFTPPTVDEVRSYCTERGNRIDPDAFVNFYASKGWCVGSQPMKDWQAAVRTWERRGQDRNCQNEVNRHEPPKRKEMEPIR